MGPPASAAPHGGPFHGRYYDGRSADRRHADVTVGEAGLALALDTGTVRVWPFAEVRQAQGANPGEPVRLERGGPLPEVLVVADRRILAAIVAAAPQMRRRIAVPSSGPRRTAVVLGALAGTAATAALLYLWVIPAAAAVLARYIPIAWEEEIGRRVVDEGRLGGEHRCEAPAGRAALDKMTRTLLAASPGVGYTYRVTVVDEAMVNAFAAPGGYIVIFRGLITGADRPEEVAGVLAHEIQHVEQRHSTTMLLREVSAGALLTAATGDATQLAQLLAAARLFGRLHFSREHEASADAGAMAMVQAARIDPAGMVRFMRRLSGGEAHEVPEPLRYLSTHPRTGDRVEALDRLAKGASYEPITLLTEDEWQALRAICPEAAAPDETASEAAPDPL